MLSGITDADELGVYGAFFKPVDVKYGQDCWIWFINKYNYIYGQNRKWENFISK